MVISNAPISCAEIVKRFPQFFVDSIGDLDQRVHGVSAPETAEPGKMVFLANPKVISKGFESQASVVVVSRKLKAEAEAKRGNKTVLIATNVELAMASVISEFFLRTPYTNRSVEGVHPTAVVSPTARLGKNVRIGPNAFIGAGVQLGDDAYVGACSVVEDETEIGSGTVIHPHVFIGHSTRIGQRCEIHPQSVIGKEGFGYAHDEKGNHYRIPHQGRVVLEDDVHIGACCTLDRATFGETRIEAGAKFDNQVHIAHNCRIGRNSLLTAGFSVAGSTKIGANFVAGGRSVVTGHIEITDNVQIAGFSAAGKSITTPGAYGGNPLVPLQQSIKMRAAMAHLPEMRKQLKRVMAKVGLSDDGSASSESET